MQPLLDNNDYAGIRQRRATVAQKVMQLHASKKLDNLDSITWDLLDDMPDWCSYSATELSYFQRLCGAFALSRTLGLWIDRRCIVAAHKVIGAKAFYSVLNFEENTSDLIDRSWCQEFDSLVESATPIDNQLALQIENRFAQIGSQVLLISTTVQPSMWTLLEAFLDTESESLGNQQAQVNESLAKACYKSALEYFNENRDELNQEQTNPHLIVSAENLSKATMTGERL